MKVLISKKNVVIRPHAFITILPTSTIEDLLKENIYKKLSVKEVTDYIKNSRWHSDHITLPTFISDKVYKLGEESKLLIETIDIKVYIYYYKGDFIKVNERFDIVVGDYESSIINLRRSVNFATQIYLKYKPIFPPDYDVTIIDNNDTLYHIDEGAFVIRTSNNELVKIFGYEEKIEL